MKSSLDKEQDLQKQLEEKTEELVDKYFKKRKGKDLNLKYNVNDNDIHLNLTITDKVLTQQEINRQKLRNKLAQERSKRFLIRDRKNYIENEKNQKKLLSSDPRVNSDMINNIDYYAFCRDH